MTVLVPVVGGGVALYAAARIYLALTRSRILTLAFRWFTGAALDGKFRTDATWFSRSANTLHPHRVVRWHHLPRALRALTRITITAAAVAGPAGYVTHPADTVTAVTGLLSAVTAVTGWLAWRKVRHVRHEWRYVRPLRRTLTPVLEGAPPRLQIPASRDWAKIWLPPEFIGTDKEWGLVLAAVTTRLGIEAPDRETQMQGSRPYVLYSKSEPPPPFVGPAAVAAAITRAAEDEVVMGIGKKGERTVISVDNDSPHVGLSMGSGDGKSATARNMLAQHLHHGGLGLVIDLKLISHMWARDLPNVAYAGTPAEIETALVWLAAEVTRRNQVALAAADVEGVVHADVGPRIMLIAEELNATQNRLKKWWQRDMEMKGRSPGSEALDEVMFLGRQVRVNVVQIGQRLSVKASGSGDARENMGVLVFADPTASAWKMLVGDRHVMPSATGHKGRLQVVTAKQVRETQGVFWTGQQARDFATSGTVAVPRPDMPCIGHPVREPVATGVRQPELGSHEPSEQGFEVLQEPGGPPCVPAAVTLREAAEAGLFVSVGAARQAVRRARLTEVGERRGAYLYAVDDLATCQPRKGQQ